MNSGDSIADYRYRGQPLTPAIIEALIMELFQGKLVERRLLVERVVQEHKARGGRAQRAKDLTRSVKKALTGLQQRGLAENPSFGHWRIALTPDGTFQESSPPADISTSSAEAAAGVEEDLGQDNTGADIVVGTGSGTVYLYYLPTYRTHAELRGESSWPCKIGRTESDPLVRVLSQAATALPEPPRIALVLRTQNPAAWESALHGVLAARGRRLEGSVGSEWFLTSPTDVLSIIHFIDPSVAGAE